MSPETVRTGPARGYAIGVVSAAILCTTSIFIKHLTDAYLMPPLVLAFWRDAIVVAALGLAAPALRRADLLRLPPGKLRYLVGYGFVLAAFNSVLTFSVALNGAAVSTVLVYLSAAFTAILGRLLFGERLGWAKAGAVLLSLAGCALVTGATSRDAWRSDLAGITTGVLSGLAYAAYSLFGRKAMSGHRLNPWTTIFYTFAFASCLLLAANLASPAGLALPGTAKTPAELLWLGRSWPGWVTIVALAAGPTLIGFGLHNVTLTYLSSSTASLLLTLEVPFTAVVAFAALGERLNANQLWGSALVLAGVALLRVWGERGARGPVAAGHGIPRPGDQGRSREVYAASVDK